MRSRLLTTFVVLLCGCLILSSCKPSKPPLSNDIELDKLNRKTIIEHIPESEIPKGIIAQDECVYALLDNSLSVSCYINQNTLFSTSMEACSGLFANADMFKGYIMTDLLALQEGDDQDNYSEIEYSSFAADFFEKTMKASSYSDSDKSDIIHSITNLLKISDSDKRNLYAIVTDLFITDESGKSPALMNLADELNNIIRTKDSNIALIALQSMCYSGIPAHIDSDTKSKGVKSISRGGGGKDKVLAKNINNGNGAKRPIYLLLFGNADLVVKYEKALIESLQSSTKYNNVDVKSLILDAFPISDEKLPQSQPLSDPIWPVLDDNFDKYAKELPADSTALSYVFSESLRDNEIGLTNTIYAWDDYITNQSIPFWRVWNDKLESGNTNFLLSFKVDNGVSIDPQRISVRYFTTDDNGATVSAIDKGNEYINIGKVTKSGSTYNIPVNLMKPQLTINKPLLFLLDATLEKDIPKPLFTPIVFTKNSDLAWLYDWTFTAEEYFETAYWWENTKYKEDGTVLRKAGWRFWLDGSWNKPAKRSFELYNKTLDFADFITLLYERRQRFINEENQPRIDDSMHQYAIFGFVLRQSYAKEQVINGIRIKTEPDDHGGYAFSLNEIGTINRELK